MVVSPSFKIEGSKDSSPSVSEIESSIADSASPIGDSRLSETELSVSSKISSSIALSSIADWIASSDAISLDALTEAIPTDATHNNTKKIRNVFLKFKSLTS